MYNHFFPIKVCTIICITGVRRSINYVSLQLINLRRELGFYTRNGVFLDINIIPCLCIYTGLQKLFWLLQSLSKFKKNSIESNSFLPFYNHILV